MYTSPYFSIVHTCHAHVLGRKLQLRSHTRKRDQTFVYVCVCAHMHGIYYGRRLDEQSLGETNTGFNLALRNTSH